MHSSLSLNAARSIAAPFREGGQQPALTSIVFSVVSLEAFLNEVADIALEFYADPAISLFVDFMVDAEKSRASLESKFVLSRWILAGQKFDRGSQPYQDFALLLGLRNDLVHFKATEAVACTLVVNDREWRSVRREKAERARACSDSIQKTLSCRAVRCRGSPARKKFSARQKMSAC